MLGCGVIFQSTQRIDMNAVVRKAKPSLIALLALAPAVACKSKKTAPTIPDVVGLAAIPATAEVVISVDVAATATAPLVQRAAGQLLLRDSTLAPRWQQLRASCKIEPETISQATLAWGNAIATAGARSVLMVVTGSSLNESSFAPCVRGLVGKGGGTLTGKPSNGRTIYYAKEGDRGVWFGFGGVHTVVIGSNESFVVEALGPGPKIASNPEFSQWMAMVTSKSPLWAVGRLDPRVGEGLVRASNGKVTAGPTAFVLSASMNSGMQANLQVVMKQIDDAKALESFAKSELQLLAMAAQWKNLGPLANKLATSVKSNTVTMAVDWNNDDLNQLLSVIDSAPASNETAPGAGVTPAPAPK
jgi:hypothetical protein